MKICIDCGITKPLDNYYKSGKGHQIRCKACAYAKQKVGVAMRRDEVAAYQAAYRQRNRPRLQAYIKEYQQKNKERLRQVKAASKDWWREYNRAYHLANRAEVRARQKAWKDANKHLSAEYRKLHKDRDAAKRKLWEADNKHILNARAAKRRFALRQAVPAWADLDKIALIYAEAQKAPGLHVDHIVPLQSDLVCGLHCEANLRVIPATENIGKGNRHWPDMPG